MQMGPTVPPLNSGPVTILSFSPRGSGCLILFRVLASLSTLGFPEAKLLLWSLRALTPLAFVVEGMGIFF